jgi:hypothetical protein
MKIQLKYFLLLIFSEVFVGLQINHCKHVINRKSMPLEILSNKKEDINPNLITLKSAQRRQLIKLGKLLSILTLSLEFPPLSKADDSNGLYVDLLNKFSLMLPPKWSVMKNKIPTPTLTKYRIEENLLVATNLEENASLGVTKSNAPALLKDFNIDWWFTPLDSLSNVGSAELIAKLLILQRQFLFETQQTASIIKKSEFSNDGKFVTFEFSTPFSQKVNRDTIAKVYLRGNYLVTLWISSPNTNLLSKYNYVLDSFTLI